MRARAAAAFVCGLAAAAARADTPVPTYDWCSSVVVRPDQRMRGPGSCEPVWSPAEIASGAQVVLLGDFRDVSEPALPPRKDGCGRVETHAANAERVSDLRRRREAAGLPPLEIVHMQRFDLVPRAFAALPGFDARFLPDTRRPWQEVLDFFQRDRSSPCLGGGCRWSDAEYGEDSAEAGTRLRDLIDASGGPGAYRRKVYYVIRGDSGQRLFFPVAAIADLRNPAYRAWRVAEAKRALAVGGYTAIHLNQKLFQYAAPKGYWIGGGAPDVAHIDAGGDTPWTAGPDGYGYAQYVAGWAALARDLRAANVPYAIDLQGPELFDRADDPSTAADEGALIHEVARNARVVLLDRYSATPEATMRSAIADLEGHGARVVRIQSSCGYGSGGNAGAPPAPRLLSQNR